MYFPYIRGRQYELLALKELVSKNLICDKVIPIVEPVKLTSTLMNTISEYINNERKICILLNPEEGNFTNECRKAQPESKEEMWCGIFNSHCTSPFVIPAVIMNLDANLATRGRKKEDFLIVHNNFDFLEDYNNLFDRTVPLFTLVPNERVFKRSVVGEKIIFADKFAKRMRNADYAKRVDEPFSDDHLFFNEEGYVGFADYSVIGSGYVESGFAPYAVAIHVVYFDSRRNMRIRHFVSDSNDDIENPAGKFYEALTKFNEWYQTEEVPPQTEGIRAFLEHYRKQTYPGLGTVKKLAIMHHLELVSQFLEGNQ